MSVLSPRKIYREIQIIACVLMLPFLNIKTHAIIRSCYLTTSFYLDLLCEQELEQNAIRRKIISKINRERCWFLCMSTYLKSCSPAMSQSYPNQSQNISCWDNICVRSCAFVRVSTCCCQLWEAAVVFVVLRRDCLSCFSRPNHLPQRHILLFLSQWSLHEEGQLETVPRW